MHEPDTRRLQNDLDVLRSVVGAELPFDASDVQGLLLTGAAAFVPALVCLAGVGSPPVLLGSSMIYVLALASYLARNYRAAHPSKPCPAAKRRDARVAVPVLVAILVPLSVGLPIWTRAAGASADVGSAFVMVFLGVLLLYLGLISADNRSMLFLAIPSLAAGLAWPFLEPNLSWVAIYVAIGAGMIGTALHMRWKLQTHDPVATR